VTEVRAALVAEHFGATHAELGVASSPMFSGLAACRSWASRCGVVFGVRAKEFGPAADAAVDTGIMAIMILPAKGALRSFLARDTVLLGCEQRAPLCSVLTASFFMSHPPMHAALDIAPHAHQVDIGLVDQFRISVAGALASTRSRTP